MGIHKHMVELEPEILTRDYGAPKKTFRRMAVCLVVIQYMVVEPWNTDKSTKNMDKTKNAGKNVQYNDGIDDLYSGFIIRTWYFRILEVLVNFWDTKILVSNRVLGQISLNMTKISSFKNMEN